MRIQVLKNQLSTAAMLALAAFAAPAAAQRPPATPATPAAAAPASNAELAASLDEHMRRLVPFGFNGSLLVERNGEIVLRQGYGRADMENGVAWTAETPFYIGSLTKQFTAAGILKLEMEGRLRVTDSIGRFFPDAPADKRGITLHQLLTHSSGLRDTPGGLDSLRTREQVSRDILADRLRTPPGALYAYSNAGYTLLGSIVEIASGMPYEQYLREKLWRPVGMTHTGYQPPSVRAEQVAVGYQEGARWGNPLERQRMPDGPTWSLRGAGGMISTPADMLAWSHALDGESVLSAEAKQKMWAPHVAEDTQGRSHYGYGWVTTRTTRGTTLVWHNGSNGIYYAELRRYVDEGVTILIASNVAEAMAELALPGVTRLIFNRPAYVAPPAAGPADPARAAAAAGTYRLPAGGTITVEAADGHLRLVPAGADAFTLVRGTMPDARLEAVGRRSVALMDGAIRGDYAPLHEAMGREVPLERLRGMHEDFVGTLELGTPREVQLVGSVARGDLVSSIVRYVFDRGTAMVEVQWQGDEIAGLGPTTARSDAFFVPATDGGWVSYDLATGEAVRMRVEGGALVVDTPGGAVTATRAG